MPGLQLLPFLNYEGKTNIKVNVLVIVILRVSSGMCVNLSIQSKCGKTWTLQILHSDTFHSVHVLTSYPLSANPPIC